LRRKERGKSRKKWQPRPGTLSPGKVAGTRRHPDKKKGKVSGGMQSKNGPSSDEIQGPETPGLESKKQTEGRKKGETASPRKGSRGRRGKVLKSIEAKRADSLTGASLVGGRMKGLLTVKV